MNQHIDCPHCKIPLERQVFNTPNMTKCPSCDVPIKVEAFPAFFDDRAVSAAANAQVIDHESSCFFHPQKKAVVSCGMCGRFICSLCDIQMGGEHICPSCLEAGKKKRKIANLENHRVLYDDIAVAVAIIPMIFFWPTILTAPASIYIALRHWKSPGSIIRRSKIRFVIAILISLLQLTGWVILISYIATR